jgi:oligopeptide/dipeptide ABC transporter ATP-binding protein
MGLLPPGLVVSGGSIRLDGDELVGLDNKAMRRVRGRRIGMVFQEPMTALNPVLTIAEQIIEAVQEHERMPRHLAWARARALLVQVRIADPDRVMGEYPHRLSGGMRQRVVIAIAIACNPGLLVADEPTTALDVTIQAQILALLRQLQDELGLAIVLITHNLGVVAQAADRVMVMYAGAKVEEAPVADLFARPQHPYTRGLLAATPRPRGMRRAGEGLQEIAGIVPPIDDLPSGCAFRPRCPLQVARCGQERPALLPETGSRRVACFRAAA